MSERNDVTLPVELRKREAPAQGGGGRGEWLISRAELLKKAAFGLVTIGAAGVVGSKVVKAADGDAAVMGGSGNTGNPNLAEDPTEVQYDGGGAPGTVFLAQADNTWSPSAAFRPAALAGWTTTNVNFPTGVYGYSAIAGGRGVVGVAVGANSLGGEFFGTVQINGDLNVTGAKNAVVPHPDGSHRAVYSVESPECWFEDFGGGEIVNGTAHVALDPDFASLVDTASYQIFLTEYGESAGLYVSGRTAAGFSVRERNRGKSTVAFGYRAVARRKDIPAPRLNKISISTPSHRQLTGGRGR